MRSPLRLPTGQFARACAIALVAFFAAWLTPRSARAGDPYLEWYTLRTPHFRVHYHGGLDELAQRTATWAEQIHRVLVPELGWEPRELVHIALTDTSEFANGSATPLPYNTIRLFATAPDDMSPLADYDDWIGMLLTHEYAHILHVDHTAGFSAVVNAIFGKVLLPNGAQPRFITEGLAVLMESAHTTGGRMRSTQFDMMLRADTLEGRLARLDQVSNPALRWPSENLWYLYGSHFLGWVHDVYGRDVARAVAADYAYSVIPYGINRSMRRVTGRTYEELYEGWKGHLRLRYAAQAEVVRARGLREGTRLTTSGRFTQRPRVAPSCWSKEPALLFLRDDGHDTTGIHRLPLSADGLRASGKPELAVRAYANTLGFDSGCNLIYDTLSVSERRYRLFDLYRQPNGTRAPSGSEWTRQRLTHGARAREPHVSPDGRHVVYVANDRGSSVLQLGRFDDEGEIRDVRGLAPGAPRDQAYTPRFSPDGRAVAYSAWSAGGYRDVRIVDIATGAITEVTHDRAIDQQPVFSPDGRYLYFTSDRTGIANVYAFELASRTTHQVTNVLGGAYTPEPSPDGRRLYYTGYTSDGFDVFVLELDRARWLTAEPPRNDRPEASPLLLGERWPVEPYDPSTTVAPRSFYLGLGTGTFGTALTVSLAGRDIAERHAFLANFSIDFTRALPQGSLSYFYDRLPAVLRIDAFHRVVPRTAIASLETLPILEYQSGLSSGLSYDLPGDFDGHSVAGSYNVQYFTQELDAERTLDPYAPLPPRLEDGQLGVVHVGYGYSNALWTHFGVGAERGFTFGMGADYASAATASDDTLYSLVLRSTGYVPLPWFRHHVLSLGLSGGSAGGTYPRLGLFYTGGFVDQGPFEPFLSNVQQSAFVLRGYEPGQFAGNKFALLNTEYRLPLWFTDAGPSTLPIYLRKVSGVAFTDVGGAFSRLEPGNPWSSLHVGVGGELWFDFVLGYVGRTTLRLGWARGLDDVAPPPQTYFVAAGGF